ncbi:MAG: cytochrome c oxidase subunit 3 family protein, partial [Geopsychrobacter sp.]|nr:cytochrome c oxidase subunit 3 family protein [Geopsychrobacter sp.]
MSHEERDDTGARFGMWVFLYTEIILFGGLFLLFAIALSKFPEQFGVASHKLNIYFGGINTLILLASSLTMAMAITAIQTGKVRQTILLTS